MSLPLLGAGPAGAGGVGATGAPLDSLSPTSAFSFSRQLLTAYGGAFYSATGSSIDTALDQSGSARNLTATTTRRPLVTTAGPNSVACANFDGSDDFMQGGTALSNLFSVSAGFIIASVLVDTVTQNDATVYFNNAIVTDDSASVGFLYAKNVSGTTPTFLAYHWDGNADVPAGTAFSTATAYVLTWRHESGTVYLSVNGGAETSTASGNSSSLAGNLKIGAAFNAFDGKIFELATFTSIPSAPQRATLISNFRTQIGA